MMKNYREIVEIVVHAIAYIWLASTIIMSITIFKYRDNIEYTISRDFTVTDKYTAYDMDGKAHDAVGTEEGYTIYIDTDNPYAYDNIKVGGTIPVEIRKTNEVIISVEWREN